jgi:hypothetical protein
MAQRWNQIVNFCRENAFDFLQTNLDMFLLPWQIFQCRLSQCQSTEALMEKGTQLNGEPAT